MSIPNFHLRTYYYLVDPELKLIHVFQNCRGLKVAIKYSYVERIKVITEDDAERLDRLVEDGYKICHPCYGREQMLARMDARKPRPGFLYEPPGYKPQERSPRTTKRTTRD